METILKSKKQNNRTKGIAKAHKEKKRLEAVERQKKYDALTLAQKIAKAVPGSKEHAKLLARSQK